MIRIAERQAQACTKDFVGRTLESTQARSQAQQTALSSLTTLQYHSLQAEKHELWDRHPLSLHD
jgi:hypothetical protein